MQIIKTKKSKSTWQEDDFHKDTHIVNPNADGEFTMCGSAYTDEDYEYVTGKVTCEKCLEYLNQIKEIYDKYYKKKQ